LPWLPSEAKASSLQGTTMAAKKDALQPTPITITPKKFEELLIQAYEQGYGAGFNDAARTADPNAVTRQRQKYPRP
jgi:hypothetical protein